MSAKIKFGLYKSCDQMVNFFCSIFGHLIQLKLTQQQKLAKIG